MSAKFNLMTDSCCDFGIEQIEATGITYLPFTYTEANVPSGGLSGVDDLFQSRSAHEFYEAVRAGAAPMTSQPSQGVYEEAFRVAISTGLPSVMVCISSGISGGYEGAVMAIARLREELGSAYVPIYAVDSKVASTTQNLLMDEAVRKRDSGLTAEEFVRWIEGARYHTQTIFMVDSLDTLHHGGRIPRSVTVAANVLDAKPLLSWQLGGTLTILGVARGRRKGMRRLVEYYESKCDFSDYEPVVAIGNADCAADAELLADMLRAVGPGVRVLHSTIGPTIGSHVGPGMLSCCFWGQDRRDPGFRLGGRLRRAGQGRRMEQGGSQGHDRGGLR